MDASVGKGGRSAGAPKSAPGDASPPCSEPPPGERAGAELRAALRVARMEDAERTRAINDVHAAELARLDLLREAIEPVLAEVPPGAAMFDAGLVPVPRPRLFIDMIAFVEMAHDRRRYRFVQETREGRILLAESERLEVLREAVTSYVARRLVEREKALATTEGSARPLVRRFARADFAWLRTPAGVALNYLGIAALVVLAWVLGHALYRAWLGP